VLCAGFALLLVEDALTRLIVNGALVGVSLGYQASPSVICLAPLWIDIPWFLTEGKPCCCTHYTFLLAFPTGRCFISSTPCCIKLFSGAIAEEEKKTSARGVLHAHPLLCFKFCFTLFLLASFYQKHKKIVSFIVFYYV
jgi:hypothetical protein